MDYIVMDLEWNQGGEQEGAAAETAEKLTFEVIEIGAVKLNDDGVITGEFHELIKPTVYHEMNRITGKLIHLQMEELEEGLPFPEAAGKFLEWCKETPCLFCTWGDQDLTELQRNMAYYNMTPMSCGPMAFLDVQKLFSLAFEDGKSRRSLEYAVDLMKLEKDVPFHRAFGDAWYTAKLFVLIMEKNRQLLRNVSY
ncbi:MAG: exonuclease domain-containing protein, partial [Acetatifactor sp.]|nr:exonuclease domain-containing protein [Acetatifactor sp.]